MEDVKIIVVEDSSILRTLLVEMFKVNNISVESVASAKEFYLAIKENTYDIAVLDVGLPDESGFSILKYIREHNDISKMGVIMLTGHVESEDRENGYNLGADVYLLKPVNFNELLFSVRNLRRRLPSASQLEADQEEQVWRLDTSKWLLTAPNGIACKVSAKELDLLKLLANQESVINKYDLGNALGYREDEHGKRALEAAVLRFRRKLSSVYEDYVPIKTVHGLGYTFSGKLFVSD